MYGTTEQPVNKLLDTLNLAGWRVYRVEDTEAHMRQEIVALILGHEIREVALRRDDQRALMWLSFDRFPDIVYDYTRNIEADLEPFFRWAEESE